MCKSYVVTFVVSSINIPFDQMLDLSGGFLKKRMKDWRSYGLVIRNVWSAFNKN